MGSPRDDGCRAAARAVGVAAALIAGALFCLFLALIVLSTPGDIRERGAVYSAAVTVLGGLHPWQDLMGLPSTATLYPVFNLTVNVEVPAGGAKAGVCLGGHSVAAVVSFDGAFLAKGSLRRLCVETPLQEGAVAATAWGADVWIPRVMKKRLAEGLERGEAEVDVAVPMRGGEVLFCKAMIGGDLSPCTLEEAST